MKPSDWEECIENNFAIKRSKNKKKAESLKKIAHGRLSFIGKISITRENANYVFEDYYSSISELIHALAYTKGFKILNHVCLGFFLREFIKREDLYRLFDDLRYKRNALVYYGEEMDFDVCMDAIEKSKKINKRAGSTP